MNPRPHPQDAQLSPVVHGGNILATAKRLGCRPADLLDLSSNLTPLGPVPGLREALLARLDEIGYLPETGSESLRDRFARACGREPGQILVGNGTTEFIFALPAALRPQRAVIVTPTYADYRTASSWAGLESVSFPLTLEDRFRLDLAALGRILQGGELVFLCNPNNPTGDLVPSAALHAFIREHPGSTFLVDETYLPFTPGKSLLELPVLDNLLTLASFSKIYGIPGLRLGFLSSSAATLAGLAARSRPWGVNRLAQVAGEFLLEHGGAYRQQVLEFVAAQRPIVTEEINKLTGVRAFASQANFILSRLAGQITAAELQQHLLARRIMVRNCGDFEGLDNSYFRVCLKDPTGNQRFLLALAEILSGT